jgi:hypothetical protein
MGRKTLLVNIELKDGTILKNCAIYPEDAKKGDMGFKTVSEIDKAFSKIPWGKKFITFQNELINGHCHVNNIISYVINK